MSSFQTRTCHSPHVSPHTSLKVARGSMGRVCQAVEVERVQAMAATHPTPSSHALAHEIKVSPLQIPMLTVEADVKSFHSCVHVSRQDNACRLLVTLKTSHVPYEIPKSSKHQEHVRCSTQVPSRYCLGIPVL